jgi:ArsR family transcriptional regulator
MKQQSKLSGEAVDLVASRFRVLGEPTRLLLLQQMMDGEKNVTDLVEQTGGSQANVSKHLSLLLHHGMVYKRREGVHIYYGVADPSIFRLCDIVCGGLEKQYKQRTRAITSS